MTQETAPQARSDEASRNEFLRVLAHELRNPLAPLRNGMQIIRLAKNDPDAVDRALDVMERQLQQMVRLIDELVEASRTEIELRKEVVDLGEIVAEAVAAARPQTERLGQKLSVHAPPAAVLVDADRRRLRQVFGNILGNALKYTGRGGVIEIFVERKSETVSVSVVDNGVGIPPEMLDEVFEMFTKADYSLEKSQDGLGIGLAVARRLVEAHDGSIAARSRGLGAGSEFVVTLPVIAAPESASIESPEAPSEAVRILIVDDNQDITLSLSMILKLTGHETRTANDGMEALKVASSFRPDIILLDIGMPKLNGYDACRVIREQPWGKDVTLVALTGWGRDEDSQLSREAGFNHHLVKPVDTAALEAIVTEVRQRKGTS